MKDTGYFGTGDAQARAPAGCPVHHGFTPFADDYVADPYGALARLRRESPVFHAPELGYLVLTRMADVAEVLKREDVFLSSNVQEPVTPVSAAAAERLAVDDFNPTPVLSNQADPEIHNRVRRHAQAGFSGRRMRLLEPVIRSRCEAMVEGMLSAGAPGDFAAAVGHPLPGETIYRLVGFPETDDPKLMEWSKDRLAFMWGWADEATQVKIADSMVAYWRYCVGYVALRQREPADDLTSELVAAHAADPEAITLQEIASVIYGLSFAGHEIVSYLLANALICLFAKREQWDAIVADPSRIPNAVEEVLRFNSPQTSWRRIAREDTDIGGVEVPAGTRIFLSLAAANRDEADFETPEIFDIGRENARTHIAFGRGAHFCLGNRLATMEAVILLETLTARVPTLALDTDRPPEYLPNFTLRGPAELWLNW